MDNLNVVTSDDDGVRGGVVGVNGVINNAYASFFPLSCLIFSGVSTAGGSGGAQQAQHAGCVCSITTISISIRPRKRERE